MQPREASSWRELASVLALYLVLSCALTWPLVAGMARDVPGDLGDSLLNMWIIAWGAESVPRVLTGAMQPADVANANIFHPEPLALAFSEHLFGQVLQVLPIYHLTGNLILSYNLLFLSTFALSGLGMYLLVRDVTNNRAAAFVAGLVFAFVPYRVAQIGHLQSLSAQWMPFALFGFRRYVATMRLPALAGGALALLMQNWSCGYYLIYFAPLVVIFVVHQIVAHGRWRQPKVWLAFAAAAAFVAAGTWPFLALYLDAQRVYAFSRPLAEIVAFSADVRSYLTAPEPLRLWGRVLQAWPKPEGELFLGVTPAVLAAVGIAMEMRAVAGQSARALDAPERAATLRRVALVVVAALAVALCAGFVAIVFSGGFVRTIAGVTIRANNAPRILLQLGLALALLAALSRRFRRTVAGFLASDAGIAAISLLLALWLSLGPVPRSQGRPIDGLGLYSAMLHYVPGFEGLRVPARYAMLAAVYLSVLAGLGVAALSTRRPTRLATPVVAGIASFAFLAEAAFAPMPINQTWGDGPVTPPARVEPAANAPAVYRYLAQAPGDLVIAEFPFGDPAWELRYVYYSTVHWKRILNGYSGGFPQNYKVRVAQLQRFADGPEQAWNALLTAGTTHVIVHEAAVAANEAPLLRAWIEQHGGRELGRFGRDVLYDLEHAP